MTDPIMKTKNTREYRLYHNITTPEQEMQRLEAIVRNLKQEREEIIADCDEARKMYCRAMAENGQESEEREIAEDLGWDCWKEETK